jgi:hypothetical protein
MDIVAAERKTDVQAMTDRARILAIQAECQSLPDGDRMDESPPLKHWTAPGVYCREIHLKGDTLVVGRIHRHRHMNIISKGRVTVFTEFGLEEITAPASFISEAGTKRVVHSHEDTIWTTIHPNPDDELDVGVLEDLYTASDYAELGMLVGECPEELE